MSSLEEKCTLGEHSKVIIPPSWIIKLPRKVRSPFEKHDGFMDFIMTKTFYLGVVKFLCVSGKVKCCSLLVCFYGVLGTVLWGGWVVGGEF